jgi:hypothetical protein
MLKAIFIIKTLITEVFVSVTFTVTLPAAAAASAAGPMSYVGADCSADQKHAKEKEAFSKEDFSNQFSRLNLGNMLMDIVNANGGWVDDLSMDLRDWSVEFIQLTMEESDESTYLAKMAAKVESLSHILRNFVNPSVPIKEPYIDRNTWVWEKADLARYLKSTNLSPFDGMSIASEPHKFAQEVIEWTKLLPTSAAKRGSSDKLTASTAAGVLACTTAEALPSVEIIIVLAQLEIGRLQQQQAAEERVREIYAKNVADCQVLEQAIVQGNERLAAAVQLSEEQHALVHQRIVGMQQVNQANIQTLTGRVQRAEAKAANMESQLNGALTTMQQQQSQIKQLDTSIQMLAEQVKELQKFIRTHHHIKKWGKKG